MRGAELIVIPAAWAAGLFKEEHWVTLVRARAIENTVWVAAAGQVPDHSAPPTRAPTGVGRSMMADPMGTVRADLGPFPGVAVADLDSALTKQVTGHAAVPGAPPRGHLRPGGRLAASRGAALTPAGLAASAVARVPEDRVLRRWCSRRIRHRSASRPRRSAHLAA